MGLCDVAVTADMGSVNKRYGRHVSRNVTRCQNNRLVFRLAQRQPLSAGATHERALRILNTPSREVTMHSPATTTTTSPRMA